MGELPNIEVWRARDTRPRWGWLTSWLDAEQQRIFLWFPVLFGCGIALYFAAVDEPQLVTLAAVSTVGALVHAYGRHTILAIATAGTCIVSFGALTAKLRTELVRAPVLDRQYGPVGVTGWIERVEPRVGRGQRLTLRVVSLGELTLPLRPVRVRVRTTTEDLTLRPGQAVRVNATLGPPPAPAAPGDFDFGRLAFFGGLGGIGLTFGAPQQIVLEEPQPWGLWLQAPIERLRQAIRARITAALPGQAGEIATALITGERGGISEDTNQAYRNSGLFHILSISGLHMVIMAGAVFYGLRLVLAAFPSIALNYPIKSWSACGAIIGAFAYLMISGASFATVRSYVMISVMFLAVILDRPALSLRNVAIAALIILIVYPESLFDAGFQMSFAAVVGLIAAYEWLRERRRRAGAMAADEHRGPFGQALRFLGEIMLSTVIASAVVAPFGIYHFHNTQLLSIIANVLAIPICNLIVMPAALGVLLLMPFGVEAIPLWWMGHGIDAMTAVARWVGALPGAVIKVRSIPTPAFALIVAGGLWLLLWSRGPRKLGIVPIAAGIALAPTLELPDVLISRDGASIAIRGADNKLSALAVRAASFDVARWLELDGDGRAPAEVATGRAFNCDAIGCTAQVKGRLLAVAQTSAALRDDCVRADVIVVRAPAARGCIGQPAKVQILVDLSGLARRGAHAIYMDARGLRVATVADTRGRRPWSGVLAQPVDTLPVEGSRMPGFTALFERFKQSADY